MADVSPQVELKDQLGSLSWVSGTVNTSSVAVPASAGANFIAVEIYSPTSNLPSTLLQYSIDNTTFHTLNPGESSAFKCRGGIKQIYLKGSVASVAYEAKISLDQAGENA